MGKESVFRVSAKNEFYASFGESFSPRGDDTLKDSLNAEMGAAEVSDLDDQGYVRLENNVHFCRLWLWGDPGRSFFIRSLLVKFF